MIKTWILVMAIFHNGSSVATVGVFHSEDDCLAAAMVLRHDIHASRTSCVPHWQPAEEPDER